MILLHGDCLEQMKTLADNSVDAIVSDPPYGISFMAKKWDYDVPSVEVWKEAMRVLKPGGHALIACGTRTQHRMVVNIEDAGFEIRDVVSWIYGSGFPKSLNIGKQIDKCNGDPNRLEKFTGWMRTTGMKARIADEIMGTATMAGHYFCKSQPAIPTAALWAKLRPHIAIDIPRWVDELVERIEAEREVVGEKSSGLSGGSGNTVGRFTDSRNENGKVNITAPATEAAKQWDGWGTALKPACEFFTLARKPLSEKTVAANVLKWGTGGINIDGCRVGEEVRVNQPSASNMTPNDGRDTAKLKAWLETRETKTVTGRFPANLIHDGSQEVLDLFPESGEKSPSRFFYCAKASKKDRNDGLPEGESSTHPTVKPTALMQYLCRLITPPQGIVLDPYMGSGSTGKAAVREGFDFVGCELDADYHAIATARIEAEQNQEPEESDQKELF